MFCQANKPNTGILQEEKKKPFCYRATHLITGKLDFLFHLQQVWFGYAQRGSWKEITYLKANDQGLVYLPHTKIKKKIYKKKAWSSKTPWHANKTNNSQGLSCCWLHVVIKFQSLNKLLKVLIHGQVRSREKGNGYQEKLFRLCLGFSSSHKYFQEHYSGRHCQSFTRSPMSSVTIKSISLRMCSHIKHKKHKNMLLN